MITSNFILSQKKNQICITLEQTCFRIHTFKQIHLKLGEYIRLSYSKGTLRKNKERTKERMKGSFYENDKSF